MCSLVVIKWLQWVRISAENTHQHTELISGDVALIHFSWRLAITITHNQNMYDPNHCIYLYSII